MTFDPKETIKNFQSFISTAEDNTREVVEIPLEEFRQFFYDFQILSRQAEGSSEALKELKTLVDQGKLIRVEDTSFKGFDFSEEEKNRIRRNFPDIL